MSYVVEYPSKFGGRSEMKIDLPRFAADLAKELACQLLPAGDYPAERQQLQYGGDVIELSADNWKKRVIARLNAPDVPWGDWSTHDKAQRAESASVNPDGRSMAAIAKDIKKRVVAASQPALQARRAYAAQQQQNRQDIVRHADALKAAHPALNVRVNKDAQCAEIYTGASGHYIDAALSSSGKVSIKRLGDVNAEQFAKIMAVLNQK